MLKRHGNFTALLAILFSLILVAPVLAGDDDDRTITVITDDGEKFVCTFSDDENIRMVNIDTGEEIFELDLSDIELAIEEALEGMEEAFEDMEFALHIDGDDNYIRFAADDDEVIVDFDAILEGVSEAVSALSEMDFIESHHRFRGAEGMDELEEELDALREEMRELKKELKRERKRARH